MKSTASMNACWDLNQLRDSGFHLKEIFSPLCFHLEDNNKIGLYFWHECRSPDTQPVDLAQQPGHDSRTAQVLTTTAQEVRSTHVCEQPPL